MKSKEKFSNFDEIIGGLMKMIWSYMLTIILFV